MAPPPQAAAPMPMPRQAPRPNLAPPKTNKVAVAVFITVTILALLVMAAVVWKVLSKRSLRSVGSGNAGGSELANAVCRIDLADSACRIGPPT
jgi:hypothetical protein